MMFGKRTNFKDRFDSIRRDGEKLIGKAITPDMISDAIGSMSRDNDKDISKTLEFVKDYIYLYNEAMDLSSDIYGELDLTRKLLIESYNILNKICDQNKELLKRVERLEKKDK